MGVVSDKEYVIHSTTLEDGTLVVQVTGKVVYSFTNETTGKSITENVSGPSTETFPPDGSFLFDGQGVSAFYFDPAAQASTGEPGLVFTSGHLVVSINADGTVQSVTLSGDQSNGCALLS